MREVKGSPQPEVGLDSVAHRMGVERERVDGLVAALEREGRLARLDDRLVVVEPSASQAPPDERVP